MNPVPGVCIVVPTYNRATLVARSVDSVLSQTYPGCRVVIVDDGSSDGTEAVLRRYATDSRVRILRHAENRGVTAAKNSGLDNVPAESRYIGILDSDDVLLSDAVSSLVRVFENTGSAYSQVMGWYRDRDGAEGSGQMTFREGAITYEDALCGRFRGDFWKLVPRDMLGARRFEERASGGEVSVWWPMLKEKPGWLIRDVVGVVDTSGPDRISLRGYSPAMADQKMWAYQAVLSAVGPDMRTIAPDLFASASSEMAKWAALAGHRKRARSGAWQAIRARPSLRAMFISLVALAPTRLVRRLVARRARVLVGVEES